MDVADLGVSVVADIADLTFLTLRTAQCKPHASLDLGAKSALTLSDYDGVLSNLVSRGLSCEFRAVITGLAFPDLLSVRHCYPS